MEFNQPNRPKKILVSVNGTPLGTLTRLRENLTLSGSTGYIVGTYERYQIIRKGLRAMKTPYGLVELTGRPKIQLCNDFFSEKELSSDGDEPRAVFKDLSWRPTEKEEHWLMAVVAWEIHHSIANTQRRIHYGDMSMDSTRGSRWR